ncbi:4-hydroxy-3-methylbut-2-enyl diphosphate reductase [Parvularcula bermudensis HTCC2503]|uniref:4-hydroxy-3-methylbut-2-enyl diphosphate reductase n=1 Tax=Parvularcula bermudensis (strain ATCC BAA-594 / HTCC2503 / KCTC 12087) TaxID=314260 RepID=E0TC91_PARBH|nr:4-hydroxy-3-methylbut-2-enyl diphosphate reductase [Parvularcula bermudensis]ADM08524.1 4-hydroxy-3-methylbut-2-enyl diphosphate reductase [Parvularcula bermudensis HTCC2503]
MPERMPITLRLAAPRGFCAGVDRAILMVERAIDRYGAPVYVRHEIVHNETVVRRLRALGAVFVDELSEVPDDAPVLFSAHGVPKTVPAEAERRQLLYLDATCPLVSKVHIESDRHHRNGCHVLLIGHEGHPEVIGTMGQLPDGAMTLIETEEDAHRFAAEGRPVAYVTQTTLSVDDTARIVEILKARFPDIQTPIKDDICYATTNRQEAVKILAADADALFVVGSETSSNSKRLVEVGKAAGCPYGVLIEDETRIDWPAVEALSPRIIALTAGASAPETVVQNVVDAFRERMSVEVEEIETTRENVTFKLPKALL